MKSYIVAAFCAVLFEFISVPIVHGQYVDDPADDALNCASGTLVPGGLPASVDLVSVSVSADSGGVEIHIEFDGPVGRGERPAGPFNSWI